MRFEMPWALLLLALIPLLLWWRERAGRRPAVEFSSLTVLAAVGRSWRTRLLPLLPLLRGVALAALIVALARPQFGVGRVETSTDAVAIQLVVDRSGSMSEPMLFGDRVVSRLDAVKIVLRSFVMGDGSDLKGRGSDLLGLIVFGTYAQTACPLVRDPAILADLTDAVQVAETREEGATAIGDGLSLAAARLERLEEDLKNRRDIKDQSDLRIKSKVIVLLTDGVQTAGEKDPLEAAELAKQWGIRVYTIGIGAAGRTSWQDRGVDEPTLRKVAEITGGLYQRATDVEGLRNVYAKIDELERTSFQTVTFTDYQERFTAPAAAAGMLLGLEVLLAATVLRRSPA